MKIIVVMFIIACNKNNFVYDSKHKNDIDYYFNKLDELDKNKIEYILEKAEEGNKKALFLYIYLLDRYSSNRHLKSKIKLLENMRSLIEYLHNNSCYQALGFIYSRGIKKHLEVDADKAVEYYMKAKAMNSDDSISINNLGWLYHNGIGQLKLDANKAIKYYTLAIDMGNSLGAYNLGLLYKYGIKEQLKPNANKAIEYYTISLNMGNIYAAGSLGRLYHEGIKEQLEPNAKKAIEYYTIAMNINSNYTAYSLGYLYHYGIKEQLEPNITKAIEYYTIALSADEDEAASNAAYNLGFLYQYGEGKKIENNIIRAMEYYVIAMDRGNFSAANSLGLLYQYGEKEQIAPDIAKAIEYYTIASDMGSPYADYNLGRLYHYGLKEFLEPDIGKAIKYYNKSLKAGYSSEVTIKKLCNQMIEEMKKINDAIKYAINLYEEYNYIHNIIEEKFTINYNTIESDGNEYKNAKDTYIDNIEKCYGIVLEQKIVNDTNSTVSSFIHNPINSDLFVSYDYICNYLESLLGLLPYLDKHGFLIDYIKLKDRAKFNNCEGDYVNVIDIEDNEYICLGENEGYNKLINIIKGKDLLLDHVNRIMDRIDNNYIIEGLKEIMEIEAQLYQLIAYSSCIRNSKFKIKYKGLFDK